MNKFIEFLREVKIELGKVSWPSKKQTTQYTVAVIVMSAAVALFLGGWDILFSSLLNKLLLK